jgi:hypothetical protein
MKTLAHDCAYLWRAFWRAAAPYIYVAFVLFLAWSGGYMVIGTLKGVFEWAIS